MRGDPRPFLRRLERLLVPEADLTRRAVASGVWVTALNGLTRALQVLLLVILARLLGPENFGLMGVALLALAALDQFSRLGLNEALVYHRDDDVDRFLDTTWSLNVARGAAISVLLVALAPVVGWAFGAPRSVPVLRAIALAPLLQGLRNPGVVYFQKELRFHGQFVYESAGALVQFVVAVGYALAFRTVWALVAGYLAMALTRTVVSYAIHGYRPRPAVDRSVARELVGYGKWITGSSITNVLKTQGDDAFVGWFLGASTLGIYQMAYRCSNAPATEVTNVLGRVLFPTYATLQDDPARLRRTYLRVLRLTALVVVPAAVGIALVAPTFVEVVLGAAWRPMVVPMQVLAVFGLGRAIGATFGPVWKAIGRPDYQTKLQGVTLVLLAVLVYPVTAAFGLVGVAVALVVVDVAIVLPVEAVVTARSLSVSPDRLLRELGYPLVAAALMGVAVLNVRVHLHAASSAVTLVAMVAVGVVVYALVVAVLEDRFDWGLREEYRRVVRAF